jgi:hypothetical protein
MTIRNLPGSVPQSPLSRRSAGVLRTLRTACILLLAWLPMTGFAEDEPAAEAPSTAQLGVELNRLEQLDSVCRVYLVFENQLGSPLDKLQLELVLFDSQGFVWRRLTLDAAPIAEDKTSVKLFDLADTQCDQMGRILINDLIEIAGPDGALPNDVAQLNLSTKLKVDLFK